MYIMGFFNCESQVFLFYVPVRISLLFVGVKVLFSWILFIVFCARCFFYVAIHANFNKIVESVRNYFSDLLVRFIGFCNSPNLIHILMTLIYFNYKLIKLGAAFSFNIFKCSCILVFVQCMLKRRCGLNQGNIKLLNNPSNKYLFE